MVSPPLPMTRPTLLEATMTHSTLSPGPADGQPLLHLPQTILRGPPQLLCQEVRHQREHGGVSLKEWKLPRPSQRPECLPLRDSKLQSLFLSAGGQPRPRLENFAQETLQSRSATQTMIQISSSRLS